MSLVDRVSADLDDAVRSVQEERDGALALNALMEDEMNQRRGWTVEVCTEGHSRGVCTEGHSKGVHGECVVFSSFVNLVLCCEYVVV